MATFQNPSNSLKKKATDKAFQKDRDTLNRLVEGIGDNEDYHIYSIVERLTKYIKVEPEGDRPRLLGKVENDIHKHFVNKLEAEKLSLEDFISLTNLYVKCLKDIKKDASVQDILPNLNNQIVLKFQTNMINNLNTLSESDSLNYSDFSIQYLKYKNFLTLEHIQQYQDTWKERLKNVKLISIGYIDTGLLNKDEYKTIFTNNLKFHIDNKNSENIKKVIDIMIDLPYIDSEMSHQIFMLSGMTQKLDKEKGTLSEEKINEQYNLISSGIWGLMDEIDKIKDSL